MLAQYLYGFVTVLHIFFGTRLHVNAETRCPLHWIKIGSSCYRTRYNYAVKNWSDGRRWCQTQNADLAKFDTVKEQKDVLNYEGMLVRNTPFWIGLHKENGEWKWADNSTVNHLILQLINRAIKPGYDCGQFSNGKLVSGQCQQETGVLCQLPAGQQLRCDTKNQWQSYGNKCYYPTGRQSSWAGAREICARFNGSLASPKSAEEQIALYDFVKNNGKKLWIGVHSIKLDGQYQWTWSDDQSLMTLQFWENLSAVQSSNEAQNMCVYINPQQTVWNKSWKTASCDITSGSIICEKPSDIVYQTLTYYKYPKTWFEANSTCTSSGGHLATRDETFKFASNAWVGQTTMSGMCPYVTVSGSSFGSCNENRTFVCNITSTYNVYADSSSPTSPGVVAVAILLVVLVLLALLLVIVWMRRKHRKKPVNHEINIEKSNGIHISNPEVPKTEVKQEERNGVKKRPDSTYDHTTTLAKPDNDNNTNQNVYDHCTNNAEDTYDHTLRGSNVNTLPVTDYGCTDDGQYKAMDRNGGQSVSVPSNYNHV